MQTELSCNAGNCVNNINGLCSAKEIKINGEMASSSMETLCETFAERSFTNAISNMPNMNLGGEIKQLFSQDSIEMSPSIACDAVKCSYNENRACHASNVQINGPVADMSKETVCETFIQK